MATNDGQLDLFEAQAVKEAVLKLSAPNGALKKALKYQPHRFSIGESTRLTVDLECVGVAFEHTDSEEDSPLQRVHSMRVVGAKFA